MRDDIMLVCTICRRPYFGDPTDDLRKCPYCLSGRLVRVPSYLRAEYERELVAWWELRQLKKAEEGA